MAFGKKERPTVDKDGAALVMRKRDYLADFSGQLGLGLMANLVGQLQYFYTDKVGIAVGSVGVVMVIAKVVDALTDIWFGNIIEPCRPVSTPMILPRTWYLFRITIIPKRTRTIPGYMM